MRNAAIGGFKVSDFPENDMNDLEIKKRARRRLVGATVLALLAVIVLPMVVKDGEESNTVPDLQVSIPESSEPESPQAVNVGDPETAMVEIEPDAASGVPGLPVDAPPPAPEPPAPVSPPSAQPVPEQSAPVPPPSAQSIPEQPAPAQPPKETGRGKPPLHPSAAEKEAEAARALALLNGSPSAKEAEKPGRAQGKVFIQVGAYNKADGATKQVEKLKKQGFSAYAEKSGKVTRVRIGPLSQSEGERAVARLKAHGHKAVLSSR